MSSDAAIFEVSLAEVLRRTAKFGRHKARLSPYLSPADDIQVNDTARYFPNVDIRATPSTGSSARVCQIQITVQTNAKDDPRREVLRDISGAVQDVIDAIESQARGATTKAEVLVFIAEVEKRQANIALGGYVIEDAQPPWLEGDVQQIGIGLTIHYARKDLNGG